MEKKLNMYHGEWVDGTRKTLRETLEELMELVQKLFPFFSLYQYSEALKEELEGYKNDLAEGNGNIDQGTFVDYFLMDMLDELVSEVDEFLRDNELIYDYEFFGYNPDYPGSIGIWINEDYDNNEEE